MPTLTKSRYMSGLQCLKKLWIEVHRRDLIPEVDAATQHTFDVGQEVGELAKKFFPKGIDIPFDRNSYRENIEATKTLLKKKRTLFEAGIEIDNLSARADILVPKKDRWDIIEVKSTTEVKEEHLADVSFQKYVYEKAGLKINKCYLMHLNKEYKRKGKINVKKLFILEDITAKLNTGIEDKIKVMLEVMASERMPETSVGRHCENPYECPVEDCWKGMPKHNVFTLYRGGKIAEELLQAGIIDIKGIPKDFKLNDKQLIQKESIESNKPKVHKEAIRHFLSSLKEPLHYLDFETISPAIPLYNGTSPYQRIPFQFSLHLGNKHYGFLADGKKDPRPAFIKALKKHLGKKGTIVTYNAAFENGVMKELAESSPKQKRFLESAIARVEDLLIPFRSFHYYHPDQQGSASIKKVLPAMTGKSYEDMDISGGGEASLAYLNLMSKKLSKKERQKIRDDLEKYCGLDTEAMLLLVEKLRELVS